MSVRCWQGRRLGPCVGKLVGETAAASILRVLMGVVLCCELSNYEFIET